MSVTHETSSMTGACVRSRVGCARVPALLSIITIAAAVLGACGPRAGNQGDDGGGISSDATTDATTTDGVGFVDEELWRLSLDRSIVTEPPVVDALGNVFVIAARNDVGPDPLSLFKITSAGEVDWEFDFGTSASSSAALAVAAGGDVWVCVRGAVSRVSTSGKLLWTADGTCSGEHSIAVGDEVAVSVNRRRDEHVDGYAVDVPEVVVLEGDGSRRWARDVGVPRRPNVENQFDRLGTTVVGASIAGSSVYVGCDTCSTSPAVVELDLADGSVRAVGELEGVEWTDPRETIFESPHVTADGVWIEAHEDSIERRTWRWTVGSTVALVDVSLPIESTTGLTYRSYEGAGVQLVVDGELRAIDFDDIDVVEQASMLSGQPAARGVDDSVLMVSLPDPLPDKPRHYSCWEQACRVFVVDPFGRVTWLLGEDVVRIPYVGDGRVVYVALSDELVAHTAPLTATAFGWAQWLGNGQGNRCRDCGG